VVPLRDDNPTRIVPVVTYTILVINIVVFVYELSLGPDLETFFRVWAVIPRELSAYFLGEPTRLPFPAWITLITSGSK
jgi:membrane associated rhomboid family serine protease